MPPVVVEDQFRDWGSKMGIHGCMGPGGVGSGVLRKMFNAIARLLSVISERELDSGRSPVTGKRLMPRPS